MIDWLATVLAYAIGAAATDAGVPEPFCVQVGPPAPGGSAILPPVVVAEDRWRRRAVARFREDGEALRSLSEAVDAGAAQELDVARYVPEEVRFVCAGLDAAVADPRYAETADAFLRELADALVLHLDHPDRFPAAEYGVMPLVRLAGDSVEDALARARRELGDDQLDSFGAGVASHAPPIVSPEGLPERALRDRDALAELLRAHGLDEHADRLAREVAEAGLLLRAGPGRSHLGGPPCLPPGEAWPAGPDGRPLTFLAGIDCAELPHREGWPAAGWWLFFGQLDEGRDGEFLEQEDHNGLGARARLLYSAVDPRPAAGPCLGHRSVRPDPLLTLPDDDETWPGLGLGSADRAPYRLAVGALEEAIDEPSGFGSGHWIGGHVSDAQGLSWPDAGVLLLHLSWDEELGLEYADGGTIQFRLPADALARGEYESVVVYGSSS